MVFDPVGNARPSEDWYKEHGWVKRGKKWVKPPRGEEKKA